MTVEQKSTTVALFGGSFNPPHVAHYMLAAYALATCDIDEVWMVPTFRHAFGKDLAPFSDRVAMCELIAARLAPSMKVCRAEESLSQQPNFVASRTLDLLDHLGQLHPTVQFRLLIGSDILLETDKWYRWDAVCAAAPPLVIGRGEVRVPSQATVSEFSMPAVSSTEIRRRLKAKQDATWLLPRDVLGYIADKGLYR
jgi:nicotinate-nucleotide adenylyltransferase